MATQLQDAETRPPSLSPRQLEVLLLVAEGYTMQEIAWQLGLSHYTVKNYMGRIYERLGAYDRVHAVAIAFRAGLMR